MSRLKILQSETSVFLSIDGVAPPVEFFFDEESCQRIFVYYLKSCEVKNEKSN